MRQLDGTGMKRLHREWRRRTEGRLALILDSVQSPFNVGAIVRTAAAMRVDHVWVAGRTPPLDEPKVGKTALGTERYLTWTSVDDVAAAIAAARGAGYRIIGIELADGAAPLHELDVGDSACLVLGSEDHGLGPAALDACDAVGFIPQLGRVGSLNVATAAAVACYEVRRRSWNVPGTSPDDQ